MYRKLKTSLMVFLVSLLIVFPAYAFFNSDVKKAKDYIQAGMIPQAIELLNKRINDKPKDAEAHLLLGSCYLQQGNFGAADQRFDSAVKLDPNNRSKVAAEYQKAGDARLANGNMSGAQRLYLKAIQYNPSLKPQIAQACFDKGAASLNKAYLDMAVSLDPAYKMKVYNLIMDKADAASDAACLDLYMLAAGYCGKECERGKAAGERLLSISKSIEGNNKRVGQYRDVAGLFIHVPPDYKVYGAGDNPEFRLRAGSETDHFIRFQDGLNIDIGSSVNEKQYILIPRHGNPIKVYQDEKPPKGFSDFKIKAVKDVIVFFGITKYKP
jgi:tetratricopeptide (TPR) repeat protein